jgi:ketosteroid isomerase-like protein
MAGASRRARLRSVSAGTPEAIHDELAAAFNSRDVDAFVDLHEEDAVTIPPTTGRPATGRGEIRASIEPVFALRPTLTNRVLRKLERDGLALTFARWRLTGTDPDGRPVESWRALRCPTTRREVRITAPCPTRRGRKMSRAPMSSHQARGCSLGKGLTTTEGDSPA